MDDSYWAAINALVAGTPLDDPFSRMTVIAAFATICAVVGILAVILDLALYYVRGQSLLGLKHGSNTVVFLLVWSAGAAIMGGIGHVANVFQATLLASATVGFTWPTIFTSWMKDLAKEEVGEEPEQEPYFEEEE